jgi:hypothetical protein
MSTDKPLVAFAHIVLSLETKLVSVYSNAPWGDLNMYNVELYIKKLGEPVELNASFFYNLKELTRIPTTKPTTMENVTPIWKLATDKFSEITGLLYSDNLDKVALADLIIEYGSLKYQDGHNDGTR